MPGLNPFVVSGDVFSSPIANTLPFGSYNAGAGIPPGAILVTCVFTFPVPVGQMPTANDQQTVAVTILDAAGNPVTTGGAVQPPTSAGVVFYGSGLYECRVAVPPGFAGTVSAAMATGVNTGQTATQPVDYSRAADISQLCITAGGPYANLLNPAVLAAEDSDGYVYVRIAALPAVPGQSVDMTGNPVEIAITGGSMTGGSGFIPAEWLIVPSSSAGGTYARLYLSALAGTAMCAGAYRVFVRLNGTTILRAPDVFIVQRSRSVGVLAVGGSVQPGANQSAVSQPVAPLPLSYNQYAVLSYQNAALTKQIGDIVTYMKTGATATRLQLLTTQQSPNNLAAPLAVPGINVDQLVVHRTLTAAAVDYLFTANQAGRSVIVALSNDNASTANMTISAQTAETISGPVSLQNPVSGVQTYILQPGESLTIANSGTAAWTQVE